MQDAVIVSFNSLVQVQIFYQANSLQYKNTKWWTLQCMNNPGDVL